MEIETLLEIKNLSINFIDDNNQEYLVVDDVSFKIAKGKITGLVGESGCGKTLTALSIMNLLPYPIAKIISGSILFKDIDLLKTPSAELQKIRGKQISMIFQEPTASLSPLKKIYHQLSETLDIHNYSLNYNEKKKLCLEWLEKVGIPEADKRLEAYPFELSGGMQQRVMIAMALITHPELLIADEPTTALDVTIQAQILNLILKMQEELKMAVLLITHDLAIVSEICEYVIIMYAGKIVEMANTIELFKNPLHPYTNGLLKSIIDLTQKTEKLYNIPGIVPAPSEKINGCKFSPRCQSAKDICFNNIPQLKKYSDNHYAACFCIN